jgi:hypothetical protein
VSGSGARFHALQGDSEMLIGVVAIWDARSRAVELASLLVFTIPATIVTIFWPAIILIVQNLG